MTTDQPQWMKDVAAAHAARRLPPRVASDPPIPTSSLEEARKRTINGAFNRELHELMGGMADIEAAARAEVIREVEAWLDEGIAYREASGDDAVVSAFETLKLFTARLHALSQGGEGKA